MRRFASCQGSSWVLSSRTSTSTSSAPSSSSLGTKRGVELVLEAAEEGRLMNGFLRGGG